MRRTPASSGIRFTEALQSVLAHDLDRRLLLELVRAGREVRYEELRKGLGEGSKQLFGYAMGRMVAHALLSRRLEPHGRRYHSFLSASPRGILLARVLRQLARASVADLSRDEQVAEELRRFFVPRARPQPARGGRALAENAKALFEHHRRQVQRILDRRHVRRLVAFGSRARGDARPDSDLDLAAEFTREADALDVLGAERELEEVLGVDVHIVELPNKRLAMAISREGVAF